MVAEDKGGYAAAAELQRELGAVERAPLTLDDLDVGGGGRELGRLLHPIRRASTAAARNSRNRFARAGGLLHYLEPGVGAAGDAEKMPFCK